VLFTPVHSCPFLSAAVYTCPKLSTPVHTCPYLSTVDHTCPQLSTPVHKCPYLSTAVYTCPQLSIPVHTSPYLFKLVHTCPHLTTRVHPFYLETQHSFVTSKLKSCFPDKNPKDNTHIISRTHVLCPGHQLCPLSRSPHSENNTNCEAYRHNFFPLANFAISLVDQNFRRSYLI